MCTTARFYIEISSAKMCLLQKMGALSWVTSELLEFYETQLVLPNLWLEHLITSHQKLLKADHIHSKVISGLLV
jgi:hypothetical protein